MVILGPSWDDFLSCFWASFSEAGCFADSKLCSGQQFYSWLLSLFLLALAITINTFLVDEIVRLLDENIPVAKIQLERNLGWNLNMAASAFCLLSGMELL